MKKFIFITLAGLFLLKSICMADDGGSYYPEDWTYGNIYVKEPNDKIALEKELMIVEQTSDWRWDEKRNISTKLHGNTIEAIFGFRNTSSQKLLVPCAFPVVVTTQVAINKDGFLANNIEVGNGFFSKLEILELAFGRKLELEEKRGWDNNYWGTTDVKKEDLLVLDKKLRTVSIKEYLSELKSYKSNESLEPCLIVQDGRNVPVQTVGIETSIEKHQDYTDYVKNYPKENREQEEVYTIKLVLHFFHELTFQPKSSSILTVKYAIDTQKGGRDNEQSFIYDISTGGTCKGDIKSFIVMTDSPMGINNSNTKFEITDFGEMCKCAKTYLYAAENYKPEKNEYFVFNLKPNIYECDVYLENRDCMQDFVCGITASSYLSGSYKIAGNSEECNEDRNLITSTYQAKTSFDGNLLNGWVEGVEGDGIGEWIEFTLSRPALGPFATNGLRRFGGSLKRELENGFGENYYDKYDGEDSSVYKNAGGIYGTWESNNRVKSMVLSCGKKNISTLHFEDKCLEVYTSPSDWIGQNSIKNPLFLKEGTYRMTIDSVYKGKKWDDTVLGEVWFIPLEEKAGKIILEDAFFKKPLLKKITQFMD